MRSQLTLCVVLALTLAACAPIQEELALADHEAYAGYGIGPADPRYVECRQAGERLRLQKQQLQVQQLQAQQTRSVATCNPLGVSPRSFRVGQAATLRAPWLVTLLHQEGMRIVEQVRL
jgi:hypothetical protein